MGHKVNQHYINKLIVYLHNNKEIVSNEVYEPKEKKPKLVKEPKNDN